MVKGKEKYFETKYRPVGILFVFLALQPIMVIFSQPGSGL
jgi:hypothetical protein